MVKQSANIFLTLKEKELNILKLLKEFYRPAMISRRLGLSKPLVSYYIRKLIARDLIRKVGPNYVLMPELVAFLSSSDNQHPTVLFPAHNYRFSFNLLTGKQPQGYRSWKMKTFRKHAFYLRRATIETSPHSIHVILKEEVWGESPRDCDVKASALAKEMVDEITELERLKGNRIELGPPTIKGKPEYPFPGFPLAKKLAETGTMRLSDDVWLDTSPREGEEQRPRPELETNNPRKAQNVVDLFKGTIDEKLDLLDLDLKELGAGIEKLVEGNRELVKNLKKGFGIEDEREAPEEPKQDVEGYQ